MKNEDKIKINSRFIFIKNQYEALDKINKTSPQTQK